MFLASTDFTIFFSYTLTPLFITIDEKVIAGHEKYRIFRWI